MAAKVGTSVSGTADGAAASIASGAKSTTTGNALVAYVKWEVSGPTLSSLTDTAGNTWVIDQQRAHGTGGEPHGAIAYALNITGNASNVVTANFSASTPTFRRIIVEEFSGLATSSAVDGTSTNNTGTTSPYSSGAITSTTGGILFTGVSDFNALTGVAAGGTPTATLDLTLSDTFNEYYLSSSGQSLTAGATASSGATRWVMLATALKNAAAGGTSVAPGVGNVTLTGFAPTVVQNTAVAPGVGTMTLSGFAPTVLQNTNVTPAVGSVTITGFAPTVLQNTAVAPGVGVLTITGFAPTVTQQVNTPVAPGVGTLTITGFAPTVAQTANQFIAPDVGTLTITGYAPTVVQTGQSAFDGGWIEGKKKKKKGEDEIFREAKERLRQQILEAIDPPVPEIEPEPQIAEKIVSPPRVIPRPILPSLPEIPLPDTSDDEIIALYLEYEAQQAHTIRAAVVQLLAILDEA